MNKIKIMDTQLIPIGFHKVMQTHAYTVIILGNEQKQFAIYTEPSVGKYLQSYLTDMQRPRPYSHDLIHSILQGFDIKILQVVITDIEDTIYFARIFLEQLVEEKRIILEIDARPSDCIPLAIMNNIPVFCHQDIFEKTIPIEE